MNEEILDEKLLQEIRDIACPIQVDVVDQVMQQVSQIPLPQEQQRTQTIEVERPRFSRRVWYAAGSVAACLAVLFSVQSVIAYQNKVDETAICDMFTDVYEFSEAEPVESCAYEELSHVEDIMASFKTPIYNPPKDY